MSEPIVPSFRHRAKVHGGCHARAVPTAARPLRLFSTRVGSTTCIELSGVLDLATATKLRTHLGAQIDAGARNLMLDMSLIRFCDAAMLRVLVDAQARLQPVHGEVRVVDCSNCVARLITVSKLEHLLHAPGG